MKEKVFVDTNIFVYLKLRDEKNRDKKIASENLFKKIKGRITINSQVINEFYSVMLLNKISDLKIQEMIREIVKISRMSHITFDTILKSWEIRKNINILYGTVLLLPPPLKMAVKYYIAKICITTI